MPNTSEPLILIPGDVDQQRGYRITKWKTYDNYECIYCQFATLFLERVIKHHAEGRHPWAYPSDTESAEVNDGGAPEY